MKIYEVRNMKIQLTLFLILISLFSFSQEKTFLFNGRKINKSSLSVNIENTNQRIRYIEFEELEPKPMGYFWIKYKEIDSILFNYNRYLKTDSLLFESRNQLLEETIISADILRQESHDTMHVVDFHFVKGELYTIQ